MNTTPLPHWKFERVIDGIPCVPTIEAEQARADLEAEVARLREALEELLRHFTRSPSSLADSETRIKAHAALESKP